MSAATATAAAKSATEAIDFLNTTGTGRTKVAVLREWAATNQPADGQAVLDYLLKNFDAGTQSADFTRKDEATGSIARVTIGRGTIEKLGKYLNGRDWQIPGQAATMVQEAEQLKLRNGELTQQVADLEYELTQARAALKDKQPGPAKE